MRWDFGGLTTEVTVSRMGHYIHIASNFVNAQKATPPRFSHAGGVVFSWHLNYIVWCAAARII